MVHKPRVAVLGDEVPALALRTRAKDVGRLQRGLKEQRKLLLFKPRGRRLEELGRKDLEERRARRALRRCKRHERLDSFVLVHNGVVLDLLDRRADRRVHSVG